jgi:hypothetical protein
MEKDLVPYKFALRMKQLGFDEPCFAYWGSSDDLSMDSSRKNNPFRKTECIAPTFSKAFRWFREKHDLHAEPYTADTGAIEYCFRIRDLYSEIYVYDNLIRVGIYDNLIRVDGSYHGTFNTPEEAEIACLHKLIEIVENNTSRSK